MALNPALKKLVSGAANKYSRSTGKALKPKEGANRYRILIPDPKHAPWMPANGQFWADQGVHWIKAEENGKPLVVVGCRDTIYQQPSLIATAIDKAVNSAIDEESKKLYESWRARKSVLVNVLNRTKGAESDDPELLELTPTTWGQVMNTIQMFDTEGEDILDPENGLDIVITRTGKGLNTEYSVNTAPGKSKPVPAEALKNCQDPYAYMEREYFRDEDAKAVNTIAQIAGVSMPRLTSATTPTPALTSSAAEVEDVADDEMAEIEKLEAEEADVAPTEKPKTEKAKPAKVEEADEAETEDDDLEDILGDLKNI